MDIVMIETTIKIIKLTASDGMVLTDGEAVGKEIYLGKYDSPDNWHEITEAEAQEMMENQEESV